MKLIRFSAAISIALLIQLVQSQSQSPTPVPTTQIHPAAPIATPPSVGASPAATSDSSADSLLKYAEFLRGEAKEHREFLESFYSKAAGVFSAIAAVFAGLLAFFNWKSKKDVQEAVNRRFDASVEALVDARLKAIDALIVENRRRFEADKEQINKILVELSSRTSRRNPVRPPTRSAKTRQQTTRVLWVDDSPENNDYPRQIFEHMQIGVQLALSTEEALTAVKRTHFDLIISDMGRVRDRTAGLTLLRALRNADIQIPVIIYTTQETIDQFGAEAIELGAVEVITAVTDLLSAVTRILFPNEPADVEMQGN